jgi:hypothetical protein
MPIFEKFKEQRKRNRWEEFDEFLRSKEAREAILDTMTNGSEEFLRCLRSNEAKQAILDGLTSQEREFILHDFELELGNLSTQKMAQLLAHVEGEFQRARDQFILFLRSDEGKRLLIDLLIEVLPRVELAPILKSAETRLQDLAAKGVASFVAHAEMSLNKSVDTAKYLARRAAQDFVDHVHQDVRDHLGSYKVKIAEAVREQLSILIEEEVARHVRSGACLSPGRSNRELALAHGISIREVKRRRRNGYF